MIWQRHHSIEAADQNAGGRDSVVSTCSSNETLRYQTPTNDSAVIQPPSEFKDLKRFPLQTYSSQHSVKEDDQLISADARCSPEQTGNNFSYLDPDKRLRVSDNTLKLIQKQALLDYYERRHCGTMVVTSADVESTLADSGFYSPVSPGGGGGDRPPRQLSNEVNNFTEFEADHSTSADSSAVINGLDHPDQSSAECLNGLEVRIHEIYDRIL